MKQRPHNIQGRTYRVQFSRDALYVVINSDENASPFEVFLYYGKSGGTMHAFTETIGRLVSTHLRGGTPPEFICRQLVGVRGAEIGFFQGNQVLSVPDAVGRALLHHIGKTEQDLALIPEDPEDGDIDVIPTTGEATNGH